MYVDVNLIEKTMRKTGRNFAVEVEDEYEYNMLIEALESAGHDDARGTDYPTMKNNSGVREHGGRLVVSFWMDRGKIRWNGFCWPSYFVEHESYICLSPDSVFIEDTDFDFDPATTLSILFGLG